MLRTKNITNIEYIINTVHVETNLEDLQQFGNSGDSSELTTA